MGKFAIRRHRKDRVQFCLKCGRKYKSDKGYKAHLLTHEDVAHPFVCKEPGCGKTYKIESHFLSHGRKHSSVETKEKAMKALETRRKKRRKELILKFPCMFCKFRTTSRPHAERHMEVRHNARFKENRELIRAHANALTLQHDQMLLALEIEDSLKTKLSLEEKKDATNHKKERIEILCASCGCIFHFSWEYEKHTCAIPPVLTGKVKGKYNPPLKVPRCENFVLKDEKKYASEPHPPVKCLVEEDSVPLDLRLNSNKVQQFGSVQFPPMKLDPMENVNVMALLRTNASAEPGSTVEQPPVVFTFQDLLILEQNLTHYV